MSIPDVELTLPAEPASLTLVRQMLSGLADGLEWDEDFLADVKLAVTEACSNVILHAYEDEGGTIDLLAWTTPEQLRVTVRDYGRGVSPVVGDRDSGGLGIGLQLIVALTRSVRIESRAGELTAIEMDFDTPTAAV